MSDERKTEHPQETKHVACCDNEDEEDEYVDLSSDRGTTLVRDDDFIDIHGTPERDTPPCEERIECRRSGGATIAEMTDSLAKQHLESEDEYLSADDGSCETDTKVQWESLKCHEVKCDTETDFKDRSNSASLENYTQDVNNSVQSDNVSKNDVHTVSDETGSTKDEGAGGDSDVEESEDKMENTIEDEEYRKRIEESLSDDEKMERKEGAQNMKQKGNEAFRGGSYMEAIRLYNEALTLCPLSFPKERSIMYSNRAACQMKLEYNKEAITSCTKALELHPHYMKALLRRAELYEKTEKLDEALADYQKAVELDPSQHAARRSALKLAEEIKERNEKMKAEMLGKLKDLGNMILKPFGMSTENFKLAQDPNSGSYSVQFQQGQQGEPK